MADPLISNDIKCRKELPLTQNGRRASVGCAGESGALGRAEKGPVALHRDTVLLDQFPRLLPRTIPWPLISCHAMKTVQT